MPLWTLTVCRCVPSQPYTDPYRWSCGTFLEHSVRQASETEMQRKHYVHTKQDFKSNAFYLSTGLDHYQGSEIIIAYWEIFQYLYLHLFTTEFVGILLTLSQKCHFSQISNAQKVRHLEQLAEMDEELNKAAVCSSANNTNKRLIFLKFDYRKYSNILLLYKSTCHLLLKWTQGKAF